MVVVVGVGYQSVVMMEEDRLKLLLLMQIYQIVTFLQGATHEFRY